MDSAEKIRIKSAFQCSWVGDMLVCGILQPMRPDATEQVLIEIPASDVPRFISVLERALKIRG